VLELRHLRYFIAVADELNFTRAARRLGIAQPALSQQIKRLEMIIGFSLLYRNTQKVELTEAGVVFLKESKQILFKIEQAVDNAALVHDGKLGHLKIGFLDLSGALAGVLAIYKKKFPKVNISLQDMTSAEQQEAIEAGELDIGFARDLLDTKDLIIETLYKEPLVLAVPREHRLALRKLVQIEELKNESFIMFPEEYGPELYRQILRFCIEAGFRPKVTQEAVQMRAAISLVASGLGISFVSLPASLDDSLEVVFVKLIPEPLINFNIVYRRDNNSKILREFIKIAKSTISVELKASNVGKVSDSET